MSIVNKISRILDGETDLRHCEKIVAILAATGLTEAQLEGLENGTMVAVDAASLAEVARGYNGISIAHLHVLKVVQDAQRAMLAAKEG